MLYILSCEIFPHIHFKKSKYQITEELHKCEIPTKWTELLKPKYQLLDNKIKENYSCLTKQNRALLKTKQSLTQQNRVIYLFSINHVYCMCRNAFALHLKS